MIVVLLFREEWKILVRNSIMLQEFEWFRKKVEGQHKCRHHKNYSVSNWTGNYFILWKYFKYINPIKLISNFVKQDRVKNQMLLVFNEFKIPSKQKFNHIEIRQDFSPTKFIQFKQLLFSFIFIIIKKKIFFLKLDYQKKNTYHPGTST